MGVEAHHRLAPLHHRLWWDQSISECLLLPLTRSQRAHGKLLPVFYLPTYLPSSETNLVRSLDGLVDAVPVTDSTPQRATLTKNR